MRISDWSSDVCSSDLIAAAGGIQQAIANARALNAGVPLMTEAEDLDQVDAALAADVDLLLVDEFSPDEIREAVRRTRAHRQHGGKTVIEYSGGATLEDRKSTRLNSSH